MAQQLIRAIYDYDAQNSEELSFTAGTVLVVVDDSDDGWYEAEVGGQRGWVPRTYVEEFQEGTDVEFTEHDEEEVVTRRTTMASLNRGKRMTMFSQRFDGLQTDDDGYFVEEAPRVPMDAEAGGDDGDGPAPAAGAPIVIARMLYDYEARTEDELSAQEGEYIQIVDDTDEEWVLAKPISRIGESGYVPANYCERQDLDHMEPVRIGGSKKKGLFRRSENSSTSLSSGDSGKDKDKKKEEKERKKAEEQAAKQREKEEKERKKAEEQAEKQREKEEKERRKAEEAAAKEEERAAKERAKEEERAAKERAKEEERQRKLAEQRAEQERLEAEKRLMRAQLTKETDEQLMSARVVTFRKRLDRKYYFCLDVQLGGSRHFIYRTYQLRAPQDFYDFHVGLLDAFPLEAGNEGAPRTIPYLPGQRLFVTESVCKERMPELDAYLKFFVMLPPHITKSLIVKEFFEAKLSDQEAEMEMVIEHQASGLGYYEDGPAAAMMRTDAQREVRQVKGPAPPPKELPPGSVVINPKAEAPTRAPAASRSSVARGSYANRPIPPPPTYKRQNGAAPAGGSSARPPAPAGPSASTARAPAAPRPVAPLPKRPEPSPPQSRAPTKPRTAAPSKAVPATTKKVVGAAAASKTSSAAPAVPASGASTPAKVKVKSGSKKSLTAGSGPVKIKARLKDDIVALLVTPPVQYSDVRTRIFKKLGVAPQPLKFKDEDGDLITLANDDDLQLALSIHSSKLILYIG